MMGRTILGDIAGFIASLLDIYILIILIRALMSWFMLYHQSKFYYFLVRITEPVLGPIRRILPRMRVDFSPVIAIILIQIIISILNLIK
ncbi:MAG TPA: YggT family protein [Candidatus Syntrophosphaera sp.]|jgi:YggT family protein|nr:YggT family protein [Candidatus Syntrophosphaera thermopropionivorans]HPQ30175.1 YggT family protein [Candidatus Syntrophosphaera thermopropionivorans]HRR97256.1 YggT family protein [Candidatus Syntrophosphaera sp.]